MMMLSNIAGKSVMKTLKLSGRTGSALPGYFIERLDPKFLSQALAQLPEGVIVVSGTNGKTTTTKLLAKLLESQGLRVLTNATGSNFVRGTISAVLAKTNWRGGLPYDIAVFEQDEAHAVHFARMVPPKGVLLLNVMRDQMDRFGEIDTTRKLLQNLAENATEFVVLNANDERLATIKTAENVQKIFFGHDTALAAQFTTDDSFYNPPVVGEERTESSLPTLSAELTGYDDKSVSITVNGTPHRYLYNLPGGHNALNLTAVLCLVEHIIHGIDRSALAEAIMTVQPAFGRGEVLEMPNGSHITLQLVKNPGGFTQALRLLSLKPYETIGIAINDDYADGRDVSWLWDVDFRAIELPVHCGGSRAADMANRLKYDNITSQDTTPDLTKFAKDFAEASQSTNSILFCTYTAMRQLRAIYTGQRSGLDDSSETTETQG